MSIWILAAWFLSIQCKAEIASSDRPIRFVADQAPLTLNPRRALSSQAQRLGSLLFAALAHKAKDLTAAPDLSTSWKSLSGNRVFEFKLANGRVDHAGAAITAQDIVTCLENYRTGKPLSPVAATLSGWKSTQLIRNNKDEQILRIELSTPDAEFPKNATLLRFFRSPGQAPCMEPAPEATTVIGSGGWKPVGRQTLPLRLGSQLDLRAPSGQRFNILFIADESVRALTLAKHDAEVSYNAVSLSKISWLRELGWQVVHRPSASVDYLALNLKHPILSKKPVRQALAWATDRELMVQKKLFGYGSVAESFLSPYLRESPPASNAPKRQYQYDPARARQLLDTAGFPIQSDGVRFRIRIRTTPVREGTERAQMLRDQWKKIGVELAIDVVEPAVFTESLKTGNFELYGSQWIGISDASILLQTLTPGSAKNRVRYESSDMTALLRQLAISPGLTETRQLVGRISKLMLEDVPYLPLWYWDTTLLLAPTLESLNPEQLSLTAAWDDLDQLRWRNP